MLKLSLSTGDEFQIVIYMSKKAILWDFDQFREIVIYQNTVRASLYEIL
jgi:hypothetical protein